MRASTAVRRGVQMGAEAALLVLAVGAFGCKEKAAPSGAPVEVARPVGGEEALAPSMPDDVTADSGPIVVRVDGKPVTTVIRLPRGTAALGDEIEVTVELEIAPLWEIHPLGGAAGGSAAGGAAATQLDLTLPQGVTAVGPWKSPKSVRSAMPDGHAVHVGRAVFTRKLAVDATAPRGSATISCQVSFQACDERTCLKPEAIELALPLTIVSR